MLTTKTPINKTQLPSEQQTEVKDRLQVRARFTQHFSQNKKNKKTTTDILQTVFMFQIVIATVHTLSEYE